MVRESMSIQMAACTKVNIRTQKEMDLDGLIGLMVYIMKDNGKTIGLLDKERKYLQMAASKKAYGKMMN